MEQLFVLVHRTCSMLLDRFNVRQCSHRHRLSYEYDFLRSGEECDAITTVTKASNMEKIKLKPTRCSNENCTSIKFKSIKESKTTNSMLGSQSNRKHMFLAEDTTINLSDYREIKVQESLQRVTSNNLPRSFSVILEDDLVESCKPGDDVAI